MSYGHGIVLLTLALALLPASECGGETHYRMKSGDTWGIVVGSIFALLLVCCCCCCWFRIFVPGSAQAKAASTQDRFVDGEADVELMADLIGPDSPEAPRLPGLNLRAPLRLPGAECALQWEFWVDAHWTAAHTKFFFEADAGDGLKGTITGRGQCADGPSAVYGRYNLRTGRMAWTERPLRRSSLQKNPGTQVLVGTSQVQDGAMAAVEGVFVSSGGRHGPVMGVFGAPEEPQEGVPVDTDVEVLSPVRHTPPVTPSSV